MHCRSIASSSGQHLKQQKDRGFHFLRGDRCCLVAQETSSMAKVFSDRSENVALSSYQRKRLNTIFQHSRAFRNFSSCSKLGSFSSSPKRCNSGPKSHSCPWVTYPRYFVIHWDAGYLPFVSSDPLLALLHSLCPRNLTCMDPSVGSLDHCGSLVGDPKWGQGCMRSAPFWLGFIFWRP